MAAVTTDVPVMVEKKESHHEMSISDIKDKFKKDFSDEINDANTYCDMGTAAEMEGQHDLADGLYEMAHDEYTHAYFIHANLLDWGCEIPEKERMMWQELKERFDRKFCE